MKRKYYMSLVAAVVLGLQGCGDIEFDNTPEVNSSSVTTENAAPVADAGEDKVTTLYEAIEIVGGGSDSDGQVVDYEWKEDNILISGLRSFTYLPESEGNHTLTLTVVDDDDERSSDTMVVIVESSE